MPYDGSLLPEVALDLMRAKQIILDEGWVNRYPDDLFKGPACSVTATVRAIPDHRRVGKAQMVLASAMRVPPFNIPWWNDTHTEAEVLAAFDAAIELAIANG